MAKKKKAKQPTIPQLDPGAPSAAHGKYLQTRAGSAAVTLTSHAASAPPPAALSMTFDEGVARVHKKQKAASDTAGAAWGYMRAPALTAEVKRELLIVKMRNSLDSKRFYRASDNGAKGLPKYFQLGTLVEGAEDSLQGRLGKRSRKGSMLHELLADGAVRKRAKQQFLKSQEAASAGVKKSSRRRAKAKGPGMRTKRR